MVIPSFNHGAYIQTCIESVICQDYRNIELIIIDDGSTDDSIDRIREKITACMNRFTRFEFRSRNNKGVAETINEAIDWATGSYFAAIASDDLLHPNKTSILLRNIDNEQSDVVGIFSSCELINQNGAVVGNRSFATNYLTFNEIITCKYSIPASSQLLRLEKVREVGGYPAQLGIEDWYMWLALTNKGYKLKIISDFLVQYRHHDDNTSKNPSIMFEARKIILSSYKNHPLYLYAMALVQVSAAIDYSAFAKKKSFRHLIHAVKSDWNVLLTNQFLVAVLMFFLPAFSIKRLVEIWRRISLL